MHLPLTIVLPALREKPSTRARIEPAPAPAPEPAPAPAPTVLAPTDGDECDAWDAVPCSLWPSPTPAWDTDSIFAPALTTYSDPCAWF